LDRLKVEADAVHYSGGVIARTEDGRKIIRKGKFVLRDNDDVYILNDVIVPKEFTGDNIGFYDLALCYSPKDFKLDFYPALYKKTDELGKAAVEDKVHIHDLHATILHLLGLDHERLTYYHNGLERRLTDVHGNVVEAVLG
jgi:hypothetical protein